MTQRTIFEGYLYRMPREFSLTEAALYDLHIPLA
jgi:hypothetical protein